VLGFIITFYAMNAIGNMSWNLMEEAQTGTLEQLYMSPAPSQMMVLGRSLAGLVSTTVQVLVTTAIIFVLFQLRLPLTWQIIPVLLITIVGLLGFGYVVGGLTLVFKHVGPLANIMQNALLITNGTFLPVSLMPAWLATTVMFFPSTLGIVLLRRVVLQGDSLGLLWADGSLPWLVIHSVIAFAIGWMIYAVCENIARKQGSLGQY
jgi:ABC-2 type transport system permease protein